MNGGTPGSLLEVLQADAMTVSQCFFAAALAALDCIVDACDRSEEALRLARARPYDLWLLDMRLHGIGGAALGRTRCADAQAV